MHHHNTDKVCRKIGLKMPMGNGASCAIAATSTLLAGVFFCSPAQAIGYPTPSSTPNFSVTFETSELTGDRTIEPPGSPFGTLVLKGTLSNRDSSCYSLWTGMAHDLVGPLYRKDAVVCGQASIQVEVRHSWAPLSTFYAKLCRGEIDELVCSMPTS